MQINNAREETVRVLDLYWEFTDAEGTLTVKRGSGDAGRGDSSPPTVRPGGAYRGPYTMGTVTLTTPT